MGKLSLFIAAASGKLGPASDLGISNNSADSTALSNILNLVYMIAGVVVVIVIIVSGIFYSLSSGDPQKVTKAKNALIYALVGLVVVVSAFLITNLIIERV